MPDTLLALIGSIDPSRLRRLQETLYRDIPLSRSMQVEVSGLDMTGLRLRAPLAPNINHKDSAFGGSLTTLCTLAGWALLHVLLHERWPTATVVIQHAETQYRHPVITDFEACCSLPDAASFALLWRTLERHGRARIRLEATVAGADGPAVQFAGEFVVWSQH